MPKRRIDPTTGEPRLTNREERLVDEYISNGGNGTQAASAAGYSGARPDQAAYRVLNRQIYSPLQAAAALARILGINPKTLSRSPGHRPLTLGYRPSTPGP